MEMELINFELELKFHTKKLNQQINLLFNFLIQKKVSMTILTGI